MVYEMIIEGNTVYCKSTHEDFISEQRYHGTAGSKTNTVKFVNNIDHIALTQSKENDTLKNIIVKDESNPDMWFQLELTDYRPFRTDDVVDGKVCWIFSW